MSEPTGQPGKPVSKKPRTVLMLGGGAPDFPLMAGALLAFHRAGVQFDRISMTGAGSVLGLIYLSPKGLSREQALENAVNYGIADAIYAMLPINYKMFQKSGYRADKFREACNNNPYLQRVMNQYGMNDADKLRSDGVQFMLSMMCPTDLNLYSTGLCAHAPFIEHVVDFAKLKEQPIDCVLNAYCIEEGAIQEWEKDVIDVHHFRASLSFPFIYPPYRVDGKHYFEGAAYEALNLGGIGMTEDPNKLDLFPDNDDDPEHHHPHLDRVIVFNIMTRDLIKRPGNLWDAYGQSIILPLVANAQNENKFLQVWEQYGHLFGPLKDLDPNDTELNHAMQVLLDRINKQKRPEGSPDLTVQGLREKLPPTFYRVNFDIPANHQSQTLEWKRSNLEFLFKLGIQTGEAFVTAHPELVAPPAG